jgi:hypothetical protein
MTRHQTTHVDEYPINVVITNLKNQKFIGEGPVRYDRLLASDLGIDDTAPDPLTKFKKAYQLCGQYIEQFKANNNEIIAEKVEQCEQIRLLINKEFQARGYSGCVDYTCSQKDVQTQEDNLLKSRNFRQGYESFAKKMLDDDDLTILGFDIRLFKTQLTKWAQTETDEEKKKHNPFVLQKTQVSHSLDEYIKKAIQMREGLELHGLSEDFKTEALAQCEQIYEKLKDLKEIARISDPVSAKQKQFLVDRVQLLNVESLPGQINADSLNSTYTPDPILGYAGKILKLLGCDATTIVKLADGYQLDDHSLTSIRDSLTKIQEFLDSDATGVRQEVKATLAATLSRFIAAKNNNAQLQDELSRQAETDMVTVKSQLHTSLKHLNSAFKLQDDKLEEIPYGAYRMIGLECNSLEETRSSAVRIIDGSINFWENSLVAALIKSEPNVLLDQAVGDSLKILEHVQNESHTVCALIADSDIATLFKDIEEKINDKTKDKNGDTFKSLVIEELQTADIFRNIPLKDIHNLDLGDLPDQSQAMIRLLRMSRDKIMGGGDTPPSDAKISAITWDKWREFTREQYQSEDSQRAGAIFSGSIDDKITKAREKVLDKYNEMTTPLNRSVMGVNAVLYNTNTTIGGFYYVFNKTSGFTSLLSGAGLITSSILFPPLGIPMLALSIVSTAGYFSTEGTLKWCASNASDGMDFFVARNNRYIDALRAQSREAIEDEEVLLEYFMAISTFMADIFEPVNVERRNDMLFFQRQIFSSFGLADIQGQNQGIRMNDKTTKKTFANINTWIIKGWDYADTSGDALQAIEKQIKTCGWRGLSGQTAWEKFVSEYGHPTINKEKNQSRVRGPFPETDNQVVNKILKSFDKAEYGLYDDLTVSMANIFGPGSIRIVGQLIATKIKPDMTARMSVINGVRKQLDEMLPEKFGGRSGRSQQFVASSWYGWGTYRLSSLHMPTKKAA